MSSAMGSNAGDSGSASCEDAVADVATSGAVSF